MMMQTNLKVLGPSKKRKKKNIEEKLFIIAMMAVPVLHFCVFWLYINIDSVFLSFEKFDMFTGKWIWTGISNYKEFFLSFSKPGSVLPSALLNSFTVFLWNDFIILPVSLVCAYILYKKIWLNDMFKVIFFLPSIISVVVFTLAYSYMLNNFIPEFLDKLGWGKLVPFEGYFANPGTAWWTILFYGLWTGVGGNIVLVSGAMIRIPPEVVEVGKLDGLGLMRELWSIVIPLIGSTIATLLLMGTTLIFGYFLQPKLLLGDAAEAAKGYTIAMYIITNVRDNGTAQMSMGAAIGVLCGIVGTPIVLIVRKILDKSFPVYEY